MTQYNQGLAGRAMFPQRETTNPTLASLAVLGKRAARGGARFLKRRAFRKSPFRHNPAPAILAAGASLLGGGLKLGRRVDPKKHTIRAAHITNLSNAARLGDEASALELQRIASGTAWPGQWGDLAAMAANEYTLVSQILETKAGKAAAAGAAKSAREGRFLQAGTDIAGTLGSALLSRGRGLRRPKRRKTRRYPAGY